MYFTIKYLAPEKYVPVIAWTDGMLYTLAGTTIPSRTRIVIANSLQVG